MDRPSHRPAPRLAIIVPCLNEEEALVLSAPRLEKLLMEMTTAGEADPDSCIVYVDDGSSDSTWHVIENLRRSSAGTVGIKLTSNVGHQAALLAGLTFCREDFDALITIDADLQDDIAAIPRMIRLYREGYDVVYGVRESRRTDTWFKRNTALAFYNVMRGLGVRSVYNHADFRLMSRRAVADLLQYRESNLFLRGLVPLVGYRQTTVGYDHMPREAGRSKYPLKKMVNFAIDGITSFSVKPVRMVFTIGMVFMLVALGILIYVLIRFFSGETIEGWTSLMLSIWFCTAVTLISLGIVGEYIGKIYIEVKGRPRFVIERVIAGRPIGSRPSAAADPGAGNHSVGAQKFCSVAQLRPSSQSKT